MTKEAKIDSISLYNYGDPHLTVYVRSETGSSHFTVKGEDFTEVMALLWEIIEKKKKVFAEEILSLATPVALQALDSKMIEGD